MTVPDRFEATFVLALDRPTAWRRLTEHPLDPAPGGAARHWLPGFDAAATVTDEEPGARLAARKDDEPCAGTAIVVTLADEAGGTRITIVQSGFGGRLARPDVRGMMAVGWRHIVADLATYLWTGAHARRHLQPWGDLGAGVTPLAGGLEVGEVRPGTLADRLGLRAGDLLVMLGNAPVSGYDDIVTVLRVLGDRPDGVAAAWVRDGALTVVEPEPAGQRPR